MDPNRILFTGKDVNLSLSARLADVLKETDSFEFHEEHDGFVDLSHIALTSVDISKASVARWVDLSGLKSERIILEGLELNGPLNLKDIDIKEYVNVRIYEQFGFSCLDRAKIGQWLSVSGRHCRGFFMRDAEIGYGQTELKPDFPLFNISGIVGHSEIEKWRAKNFDVGLRIEKADDAYGWDLDLSRTHVRGDFYLGIDSLSVYSGDALLRGMKIDGNLNIGHLYLRNDLDLSGTRIGGKLQIGMLEHTNDEDEIIFNLEDTVIGGINLDGTYKYECKGEPDGFKTVRCGRCLRLPKNLRYKVNAGTDVPDKLLELLAPYKKA
jgi:hypothetical protein